MNRWKVYATVIACMLFGWIGVEAHASKRRDRKSVV